MAPDVSFSTDSLEFVVSDGSTTEPDDFSSASSGDVHIGAFSRPQLPPILSNSTVSKSLPSKLHGGILPRRAGPPPRSQSARPHQATFQYQRASRYSPRPQPHLYPPPPPPPPLQSPHPPHHPRILPSHYPPPPPPPPLARPVSSTLPPPLDRHDRLRSNLAKPQSSYDDRGRGDDHDGLFSSVQESNDSGIKAIGDPDYVQQLTENFVELRTQRSTLSAVFGAAKAQREHVRRLRQYEDEANQRFIAAAQALLPDGGYQLQQLFKAMQDTHQECQKAEQRLEETVDELHQGQENLGSQEEIFYRSIAGPLGTALLDIDGGDDRHSENREDWALRGITGDRPEATHPLYEKLRVAFSELQLARELLANTQMKRDALHNRKAQPLTEDSLDLLETYGDAGRKKALELRATALLTEEDAEQLREYDELEKSAERDIEIYSKRVAALQRECREKGALPSFSYFHQEGFGVDSIYRDEIRLTPSPFDSNDESATLAHPVFPLLHSNPTHLLHGFPQTVLQSLKTAVQLPPTAPGKARQVQEAAHEVLMNSLFRDLESEDKSEYINRWLLHKLRHSALEAELLWTTFHSRMRILDMDRWQRDVLQMWWRDNPVDLASIGIGDNETDKAAKLVASRPEFNMLSHSDPGQLAGLGTWNLDDSWL